MSVKRKLPIYIGGLVTASLLVSGYISYNASSNALVKEATLALHTNTERTANLIDALENGEVVTTSVMANNKRIKDLTVLKSKVSEEKFYSNKNNLLLAVNQFLEESFEKTTNHAHFFIIDKNGFPIADSDPKLRNQTNNYKDRDYFKGAMAGKVTIGKMVMSKTSGKPVVVIGVPIKNDAGQVRGVLANSINAEFFTSNLSHVKVGNTGQVTIRDSDGLVISHPDKSRIGKLGARTEMNEMAKSVPADDKAVNVIKKDFGTGSDKNLVTMANIPGTNWVVGFENSYTDIQAPAKKILMQTIWVVLLSIVIATLLGLYLSRMVTVPLSRLTGRMKEMSEGNLNVSMDRGYKDEFKVLAESFNTMSDKMKTVISHMNQSIGVLDQSTNELDASAKQTAQAINETATTTSEIARAVESQAQDAEGVAQRITELGGQIDGINNETELVKEHTNVIIEQFSHDKQVIENLLKINEQSYKEMEKVAQVTQSLEDSSQNIGNITKVISGIADQTNLLALNASIEAARAGEAGRGFAVVADEIRKLAEQSSNSVKEIDSIIRETQNYSKVNTESIHSMQAISNEQSEYVARTKESFDKIMNKVTDIATRISVVATELENMQRGKDEVVGYVQNVSASTEEVSASVQEVAAASEEQSATVQQLAGMVETINSLTQELAKTASVFKI
ncbi:methyl-accepting chemotaxis protein [Peribacillus asahii]|uniref:methyl-accepting chemotaxis protein n=1 Tax=Peribacillus asahii TaxID=228899 RepID=UPI0038014816